MSNAISHPLSGADGVDLGPSTRDFTSLLKPRVMSLVIFTAFAGMALAPGGLHPLLALVALAAIAVGAGASGALNMALDEDIDRLMRRTAGRPVPAGRVSRDAALTFGTILSVLSVMVLALAANWLAAALLAFTIGFYVVIYTMVLKRRTAQNIVIGGAAGALPPVVGWAAASGSLAAEPWAMFLIIFLWTPAHFWALAILVREDYARAGVPMMPVVASARATRLNILAYAGLTALSGLLPVVVGGASLVYAASALALGLWLVQRAIVLVRADADGERRAAGRLFAVSILYLFALFGVLILDRAAGALL